MKKPIRECKYFNPKMNALLEYCKCLYRLEGCGAGGLLHILLDDDNFDDDSIKFCLDQCIAHPEREERELGTLICLRYLGLTTEERCLFDMIWCKREEVDCCGNCSECEVMEDCRG